MNFFTKLFMSQKKKTPASHPSVAISCKMLFRFYSNMLEQWAVETLWAKVVDAEKGLYQLDNIPFYASSIACDDIVKAEFDETEQFLTFREVVTPSGNSTVQIVLMLSPVDTNTIRDFFNALGCSSEKFKEGYFVLDVPARLPYDTVKALLSELFEQGTIDYAEACLSDNHRH
jgi:hypothetical protein